MSRQFQHKVDCGGDTDENNHDTDESQSEKYHLVKKLEKEQEYEKYNEWNEDSSIVAKTNVLKMIKSKV